MRQVGWTAPSLNDLRRIDDYLRQHDAAAAQRILKAVRDRAELLTSFPQIGPALNDAVRRLTVRNTNYILFYRLASSSVQILRVRHQAENWRGGDA